MYLFLASMQHVVSIRDQTLHWNYSVNHWINREVLAFRFLN